jgi:general secretion pathway protein D
MIHGIAQNSGVSFTDTTRQTEGFNLTYQGILTKPQFQVVLHTLEETKKIKTLSSPRITTLDNQMATIKVVDEWIYPTRYEFQIVQFDLNGDGDFNDANETLYKNVPTDFVKRDVGILLRVTPSVGIGDETITLTLIPEVSDATAGYFSYTGDVSLPLFSSRNLSTSVVVSNGDTVVLGGLMKETQTKVATKIPILGDMPWIGKFFRKDTDSITRKNLLIFVTATIISPRSEEVVFNRS